MQQAIRPIDALAPASALAETVTVVSIKTAGDGRTVEDRIKHTITPFTYSKMCKVLGHVERIFAAIDDFQFDDPIDLTQLIMHAMAVAGDDVQAVVCLAIDKPLDYLDTLMPDDGLKLTAAVVRVAIIGRIFIVPSSTDGATS